MCYKKWGIPDSGLHTQQAVLNSLNTPHPALCTNHLFIIGLEQWGGTSMYTKSEHRQQESLYAVCQLGNLYSVYGAAFF